MILDLKKEFFVLHHPSLTDRRRELEEKLKNQRISPVTWIDKELITNEDYKNINSGKIREHFDLSADSIAKKSKKETHIPVCYFLSKSQMDLALRHLEAFKNINADYAVIFEDDVLFEDSNFLKVFDHYLSITPKNWHIISFSQSVNLPIAPKIQSYIGKLYNKKIYKQCGFIRYLDGTASYIIKKEVAILLLANIDKISLPIDLELHFWIKKLKLNVYWWLPSLVRHKSIPSSLHSSIDYPYKKILYPTLRDKILWYKHKIKRFFKFI